MTAGLIDERVKNWIFFWALANSEMGLNVFFAPFLSNLGALPDHVHETF